MSLTEVYQWKWKRRFYRNFSKLRRHIFIFLLLSKMNQVMFKKFIFDPSSVTNPNNLPDKIIAALYFNEKIFKGYCSSTQHERKKRRPKIS